MVLKPSGAQWSAVVVGIVEYDKGTYLSPQARTAVTYPDKFFPWQALPGTVGK